MNVLVIGATGTIGRQLVKQTLNEGNSVTALVRDLSKLNIEHPSLEVVTGDVLNQPSLSRVMPGHDAVMVALGAGMKGGIRATGTQNVIQAMKKNGIKRLICLSSLGVGESRGNLNFFWKYIMFGVLLRRAMKDHIAQENYVRKSELDWTIVRPAAFTDGEATGIYQHGFGPKKKGLTLKISRADVAHFFVNQLKDRNYLLASPGLSY